MKKVLYILVFIISLFIINSLIHSIYNLWQKKDLVSDAQEQLRKERNEHEKLKDQLARVKRPDFVEEEARNKLFMVKEGESIVLIGEAREESGEEKAKKIENVPNWKQWWNYFF